MRESTNIIFVHDSSYNNVVQFTYLWVCDFSYNIIIMFIEITFMQCLWGGGGGAYSIA